MHLPLKYRILTSLAAVSIVAASSMALADDTTTTTTRQTTESPAPGIVVGVPGVVGVEIGGGRRDGCVTRQTTRTDEEPGDSATTTRTRCNCPLAEGCLVPLGVLPRAAT